MDTDERTIILCTEVVLRVAENLFPCVTDDEILTNIQNQAEAWIHDEICGTQPAECDSDLFSEPDLEPDSIGTFEFCETWLQPEHEVSEEAPLPDPWKADPVWSPEDWTEAVQAGDTRLGYAMWVEAQREMSKSQEREACAIPVAPRLCRSEDPCSLATPVRIEREARG